MRIKATIVSYVFLVQYFENTTIVAYAGLRVNEYYMTVLLDNQMMYDSSLNSE